MNLLHLAAPFFTAPNCFWLAYTYASQATNDGEKKYAPTKLEMGAIVLILLTVNLKSTC